MYLKMLFILLLCATLAACSATAEQDAGGQGTGDLVAGDVSVEAGGDATDAAYPPGPYGTKKDKIVANHAFFDPDTGKDVSLAEYYKSEKKILLLNSSAGWCGSCAQEAVELNGIDATYGPRGLVIMNTLFQDWNGGDPDEEFWGNWVGEFQPIYRTVLDKDFVLSVYFNPDSAPMHMLIDLSNMKILSLETGYDKEALEGELDVLLPSE